METQIFGSDTGKRNALSWLQGHGTNKRSVDSSLQKHVLRGLLPSHNEDDRLIPHLWMPDFLTTANAYTHPAYSLWLICTGAGAAMTRPIAGMWETEVHLALGFMWVEEPGSCSWRALT